MTPRRLLRLVAVVLPAVLLSLGWLYASVREATLQAEAAQRAQREQAARVRAAVDESLEELRLREDRRPFYLYSHYYSPPDVLAVVDPVAVSPLAKAQADLRIIGHLQVNPGPEIRVPYTPSGTPGDHRLAARLLEDLGDDVNDRLAALTRADPEALAQARQFEQRLGSVDNVASLREGERLPEEAQQQQVALNNEVGNAYTVSLGSWSNKLAQDIQRYNNEPQSDQNFFKQQRVAPKTKRRIIEKAPPESKLNRKSKRPPPPPQQQQQQALRPPEVQQQGTRPQSAERPRVQLDGFGAQAPAVLPRPDHPAEEEVDYTEMSYERIGGHVFLTRTVAHGGVTSAQAVRLDLDYIQRRWLPELLRRHASAEHTVWVQGSDIACPASYPASDVLVEARLCFDALDVGMPLPLVQGGLLAALLFVLLFAGVATARAEQRAVHLADQQRAFVSAVSHELRTPLTTIRMNAEMLADGLVSESKVQTFLQRQVSESVRLSHLVENVLEVSRLEAGRRPLRLADGDLAAHVRQVVESQRPFLGSRDASVTVEVPEAPVIKLFDAQAMEQVLINLLENAAKYGKDSASGEATIAVTVERQGAGVRIRVADQGPGVAAPDRDHIFDRFFRARRKDEAHVVGTGLGLSLVRDLVRAHGGDVRLAEAERGCIVQIDLP